VGLPALALWAAAPHYLAANPNPKAMLALVELADDVLRLDVDTTELETVASEFGERVTAAMESSSEFANYVAGLEQTGDGSPYAIDPDLSGELVDEIEDYLRRRG
jgi:predicted ATP-grasp superfamily ATP-dependent carboligase